MERHTTCTASNSKSEKISGTHTNNISKDSGCRLKTVPLRQQVKTIKIPRAMKNEAFLKHPDLTMGQKRYLCSIARIYSTSNMRTMTEKHLPSKMRCDSKKAHLNLSAAGKSKNEIKGHCRRVHTAITNSEARTIEDMREQITCLSMNETNCDG
ncbi:protein FAM216A isoform 2-T2 [Leptodactylus fuscus]|uniref:protein FAM216A isoform X2 n=1 Tax=Leptodactylus fuscus TaxID=238119 RepID=UPI003F4E7C19